MDVSEAQLSQWYDLGVAEEDAGRPDAALAQYDAILEHLPRNATVWGRRGSVLWGLQRFDESLSAFDAAVAFASGVAEFHYGRGTALQRLDRLDEAVAAYERTVWLDPRHALAMANRAASLCQLGRYSEATAAYDRVLAIHPDDPWLRSHRGLLHMLQGRLEKGWSDYEARFFVMHTVEGKIPEDVPLWQGEDLAGKRLLLQAEQGLGDVIQFCRYALKARAAAVVLQVHTRLKRLLADNLSGIQVAGIQVVSVDEPLPACDVRLPLMSMPGRLNTTIDTIYAPGRYLAAEPARVAAWRAKLGEAGFKIAIAWQGETISHGLPKAIDIGRSFPLALFAGLATIPGVRLISLQKGDGAEQLAALPAGMRVEDLGPDFDAGADGFLDSAAVMETCDLTITSDTAIAHLAGALDVPVWVALRFMPDWRWFLQRSDSPWYPSMRLFRQPKRGDWQSVFRAMEAAVRDMMAHKT